MFESAADGGQKLLALKRLEEVVVGAIAQGLKGDLNVVDSRDHDDGQVGVAALGALEQGDAIHFRHHEVGEDEVEFVAGLKDLESFYAAASLTSLEVSAAEHGSDNLTDCVFIVNNEDAVVRHAGICMWSF